MMPIRNRIKQAAKRYVFSNTTAFIAVMALFTMDLMVVYSAEQKLATVNGLDLVVGFSQPAILFVSVITVSLIVSIWRPKNHDGYLFLLGAGAIVSLYGIQYQIPTAFQSLPIAVRYRPPFHSMAVLLIVITATSYLRSIQGNNPSSLPSSSKKSEIHINITHSPQLRDSKE